MAELERASIEVDEYSDIGGSEADVACVSPDVEAEVFATLGLKPISIRLPASLIDAFKAIATLHGVGYQPLMRDALERFAVSEMKRLTIEYSNKVATHQADSSEGVDPPEFKEAA